MSETLEEQTKQAVLDDGVSPLVGGGAGLLGGYMLGSKVIAPLLKHRETILREQLRMGDTILDKLRRGQRLAPLLAGAAGAVILASLASKKAKSEEKNRIQELLMYQQLAGSVDAHGDRGPDGFESRERVPFGAPRGYY